MMLHRICVAGFILMAWFAARPVTAQQKCATVEYLQQKQQQNILHESELQFEKQLAAKTLQRKKDLTNKRTQSGPYRIPVVVHVIHWGEPVGTGRNISDEQILSQIDVLNKDFNRLNTDAVNTPAEFLPVAGSIEIEFVLARQDPNGYCTNGINRVYGSRASWQLVREAEFKALSYWPAEDYLNIWVIAFQSYLGYAQFPVSSGLPGLDEEGNRLTDGIVVDYRAFGVGSSSPYYNLGRTATHEVGHFLGLRHIWGDDDACAATDYVSDTPPQKEETYDCPAYPLNDDCSSSVMFQNFMDYSDDVCLNLFTNGQIDRIVTVLENSPRRNSLLTSHGLEEPSSTGGSYDLALTVYDFPDVITCSNDRNERQPLMLSIANLSGIEWPETLILNLTVNQQPSVLYTVTGPFEGNSIALDFGEIPNLVVGDNTLKFEVAGCDPDPSNNAQTIDLKLLDSDCEPFVIYTNHAGQSVITFDMENVTPVEITLVNLIGQHIGRLSVPEARTQTLALPRNNHPSGPYIVRIRVGSKYYSRKTYVQ